MEIQPPGRGTRRIASTAVLLPLALALLGADRSELSAQHRVQVGADRPAGITTVTPHSGPVGSVIAVQARSLPAGVPVQIMIGALRSGFEVVAAAVSDEEGVLAGSGLAERGTFPVTVPEWVQNDRSYLLILTDREYNPLAVADVFHPTDANGWVLRKGRISNLETECPTLTNESDELYFLGGDTGALAVGDEVVVEGTIGDSELCGPGTTIDVMQIRSGSR